MKKFEYNLESLLKVRSHKVKEEEQELGKIIAERIKRENKMMEHQNEINGLLNNNSKNTLAFLKDRDGRIEHLETSINKLKQEIKNVREIENIQR
ncbi:hypothetical protein OAQ99_07080, partial [Candidatus Kapabacteria bacterium]|nr:hypothetical protein [Candidatus Kapabacteria bacterium]